MIQRLKRFRCWLRGYHIYAEWVRFDYNKSGVCDDCGKVGDGILID